MYLKSKLMKWASICSYVFTFLWIVMAACFFALSTSYWYVLFFALGLVSLYDGFIITSVREKMTGVNLEKNEQTKFLVCWIISIVCPPAFVLNAIAYFRKTEDKSPARKQKQVKQQEAKPQGKKRWFKTKSFITMCVAFALIFIVGFAAMCFETSGFSVKVSDFTLTPEMTRYYNNGEINGKQYVIQGKEDVNGNPLEAGSYAVTMYVPKTATEDSPAPTVFVLPGFTRTKATMAQYAIELSRRGAVVFTLDPGGQGATTEQSTQGANGIEYLVQYVYNNTDDFKFCDKDKFGAIGHSAGAGNVTTLASDMAGTSYETSIIKSVYISGYIKLSSINRYKNFHCNAALAYAYYDEGAFRYQTDSESFEVASLRFINEVNGANNGYTTVEFDTDYGDVADGSYRVVHHEDINHCFEMYDPISIANTINFFDMTLGMNSGIKGSNQIWFGKEFLNGVALASAFTFIIALCAVLVNTPVLKSLVEKKVTVQATETGEVGAETDTVTTPIEKQPKTVAHKVIFWSCLILTATIACLDYIPLAHLSIKIFPTSNAANVYTYTFPARMVNAILLWAAVNGAIGLVIFFATTLVENLIEWIKFKKTGATPNYEWDKFKAILIKGNGVKGTILNVLKAVGLALVLFGVFYFVDQISYWCFHQDFRFMLVSAAPLNARMFVTALEYMPIIFIFYISNSIRVNCSIGREGMKEWKVTLLSALANSIGLAFILLINYVCYFATGTPFYGYWGNKVEVWLFINMVFALVVMMFILPIFNRLFYKITGNVWTGAIACCMIFVMMTISASVSYIPLG